MGSSTAASSSRNDSLVDSAQAARATRARAARRAAARGRRASASARRWRSAAAPRARPGSRRARADDTNGPAAPARALYLEGFALYLAKSDARCADVDESASDAARRRARALVVAAATSDAARDAWRRVVRDIDGGATRHADDAALRAAAARGDGEEVAALLEGGRARVDAADEYGRTALFLAAAAGQNVELLLAAGADPTRQAHGGWKPSHFIPREPLPLLGPTPPAWRLMIARDPPAPTATTRPLRGLAHPGAGSVVVDGAATADEVPGAGRSFRRPRHRPLTHCLISTQARTLPVAPAEKARARTGAIFMMPTARSAGASRASRRRRGACPSLVLE